ncbi:MAG: hypothetical protein M3165_10925 [Actinomycetota bacterium]|nr:hypothetical protein [Actinomycetota bacterium]
MTTPQQHFAPNPMYVPRFFMRQRITMMVNQYEIHPAEADGSEGPLLAFAQQKRMAFKEEVVFYADTAKTRPVFSFKARKRLDLGSGYDVFDELGRPLGHFRKEFGRSLLRSTWSLSGPGLEATGTERRLSVAILRRVWELIPYLGEIWVPFVFHFDFLDRASGQPVMSSERARSIRDRYTINVPDQRLDFRLAASMAVALDALQSR